MFKHQAQTYKAGNTGAMICFFPGYNFAEDLAIPDASESPDDLHLTLAYLGEARDIEYPERLLNFVAGFALTQFPIRGRLNGTARFVGTDNDKDPAVCLYDSPALPQFRQDLVNGLKSCGVRAREDHGFIPHITLDYIPPDQPMGYTVAPLPLAFYSVWVVLGDTRFEYQLTGEYPLIGRALTSEPLALTSLTIMESIVALQGEEDEVLGLFVKDDQFYANVGDWVTQVTLDAVMQVLPGVEIEAEAPPPGDGWTQLWPPVMAAKAGARNSRVDIKRIQAVHDLMCELGAECHKPEAHPMKSAANGQSKNLSSQDYAGLIGLSQAMVLHRGTSSSGNWGHVGRQGKKGGSGKGGGHAAIGAKKGDSPQKIKEKATKFKQGGKAGGGGGSKLDSVYSNAPKSQDAFTSHLIEKVGSGEISFSEAQQLQARFKESNAQGGAKKFTDNELKNGEANKEWNSWEKSLSKSEKSALENYQSEPFDGKPTDYIKMNSHLRGQTEGDATTLKAIDNLDSAINKGTVPQDTTVYRGVSSKAIGDLKPGQTIQDSGFVSTSLSENVSSQFGDVLFEVKVPKGSNGAYMDSVGTSKTKEQAEYELVLPRNSSFRITGVSRQGKTTRYTAELVR